MISRLTEGGAGRRSRLKKLNWGDSESRREKSTLAPRGEDLERLLSFSAPSLILLWMADVWV